MILASSVILSCCQTWGFLKEFSHKKMFMVLLFFHGSLKVAHSFVLAFIPYFTSPVLMVYVEFRWMRQNVICLTQICCKVKDWIHRFILIFMTDQVTAQINTCSFSCLTLFARSCFFGMPSFLSFFLGHASLACHLFISFSLFFEYYCQIVFKEHEVHLNI